MQQNTLFNKFSIEKKKYLKILMMLFSTCNNNCSFCFQKNFPELPTIENFKKNISQTIQTLHELLEKSYAYDKTTVNLMGGELFYSNNVVDEIKLIVDEVSKYNATIRLATNLLYDDLNPLFEVIDYMLSKKCNFGVFSSYDFGDIRFNCKSFKLFKTNYDRLLEMHNAQAYFGKYTIGVETTRTKYMLKSLIGNDEQAQFFRHIVDTSSVCIDELIGDYNFSLTYAESVQLWKKLITDYRNITDLPAHFVGNGRNCLSTTRIAVVDAKPYYGCLSNKYRLSFDVNEDKFAYVKNLVQKNDCINCKYYKNCPIKCPIEKHYEKCDIKEVKQWIEKNNICI